MSQQILLIHGGVSFDTHKDYLSYLKNKKVKLDKFRFRRWKENLREDMGNKYDVLLPKMPNYQNVIYEEWKIWLEKILEELDKKIILVGHSLGGVFLAKYLSENETNKNIIATFLVAAPFKNDLSGESLKKFILPESLDLFSKQSKLIYLLQSKDDPVVPQDHLVEYKKKLPNAKSVIFNNKGHFDQEHFPEIVKLIKSLK